MRWTPILVYQRKMHQMIVASRFWQIAKKKKTNRYDNHVRKLKYCKLIMRTNYSVDRILLPLPLWSLFTIKWAYCMSDWINIFYVGQCALSGNGIKQGYLNHKGWSSMILDFEVKNTYPSYTTGQARPNRANIHSALPPYSSPRLANNCWLPHHHIHSEYVLWRCRIWNWSGFRMRQKNWLDIPCSKQDNVRRKLTTILE